MPIITKNNKKYIDFLKEAREQHILGQTINFKGLQEKYQISNQFVKSVFEIKIVINMTSKKYPFYCWMSDEEIDNNLII